MIDIDTKILILVYFFIVFVLLSFSIMYQYMDSYVQSKTIYNKCGEEFYEYDTFRYKFLNGIDRQYFISLGIHLICLLVVLYLFIFSYITFIGFLDIKIENMTYNFTTIILIILSLIGIFFYTIAYSYIEKNDKLRKNIEKLCYTINGVLSLLILVYIIIKKWNSYEYTFIPDILNVLWITIFNIIVGCYIFLFNHILVNLFFNYNNSIKKIKELFTYIIFYKDDYDKNDSKKRLEFTFWIVVALFVSCLIFRNFLSNDLSINSVDSLCKLVFIVLLFGFLTFFIFDVIFKNVFTSNENYYEIIINLQKNFSKVISDKQLFKDSDINLNIDYTFNDKDKLTYDQYQKSNINLILDTYKLKLTNHIINNSTIKDKSEQKASFTISQKEYIETVVDTRIEKLKDYLNSNKKLTDTQFNTVRYNYIDSKYSTYSINFYLNKYDSQQNKSNSINVLYRDPNKSNRNLYREIIKRYNLLNNKNIDPESTEFKNIKINEDYINIIDDKSLYNPITQTVEGTDVTEEEKNAANEKGVETNNYKVKESISINEFKNNYDIRLLPILYISLYDGNIDKALQSIGMQSSSKDIYDNKKKMFNEYAKIKPKVEDNIYGFAYMAILIIVCLLILIYIILHYILKSGVFGKNYYNYMTALAILIILISSIISFIMYKRNF